MGSKAPALTGLEQVRALIESNLQPPFGRKLRMSLVDASEGHAIFEGTPDGSDYNPIGTVHGGYAASLLDSACGIATHTALQPGQGYTTAELKVSYMKPLTVQSGKVRAEGRVVSIGSRAAFAEANLTDEKGRLCATATSTLIILSQR